MADTPLLWQSESNSMTSSTVGRVMNTLLSSRPKKLEDAIVRLGEAPKSTSSVTLEDSLRILNKYVRDVVDEEQTLDEVLIPIIENVLRCKELKHPNQAMILLNWLFQDESLFLPLAQDLVSIVSRREDHYIALGWCKLVRSLVKYEIKMTSFSKAGIRDNYPALLKTLSSSVEHLAVMVKNGSVLQDGFELPTRLSAAAADCILVLTEALTQKLLDSGNLSGKGACKPNSNKTIGILKEKLVEQKNMSSEVFSNVDGRLLLWQNLDQLIILVQKLQLWSQKSRTLHAKGLGQILKWLQQLASSYTKVEAGSQFQRTLLSSCWRHYSVLALLEDIEFYQRYDELVEQYLSGIEFYSEDNLKDHVENRDSCIETNKFFLNCLALLLGRLDLKRLECTVSLHGQRISRALLSQLHCADEDVVDVAVCIFRLVVFKIAGMGSSLNNPVDSKELLLPLLGLLDERDGAARAVTALIADYCSVWIPRSADDWCLNEVLKRLASGSISGRRNAADVISEFIRISLSLSKVISWSLWQEIAKQLLDCLEDEDSSILVKAMSLLPLIDPSLVLPSLVRSICSTHGTMRPVASNAFIQVLRHNSKKLDVIRMVLDLLSDLSHAVDDQESSGGIKEDTSKFDVDEVFKLIPEWSKTVQDWNLLVGPLVNKMLSEPTNAIIVRFLSSINEHLADAADLVLQRLLVKAQEQEEMSGSTYVAAKEKNNYDADSAKDMLFDRLCPLLVIKMLPLRVFDDFNCMTMYSQILQQCVASGADNLDVCHCDCVATLLFNRAFCHLEYEDVRKLAAELCGRIHPQVLFPVIHSHLQRATESKEVMKMKACLFALCTSLVIRGSDSVSHPDITKIVRILQAVLLWPSVDGDEVSKAQHGCIDCLALIICAELQAPKAVRGSASEKSFITQNGCSVLSFVISKLTNDEDETGLSSGLVGDSQDTAQKTCIPIPFRLCMANVLISTCQKVPESAKKAFAKKTIPCLVRSSQAIQNPEIRAACVQVLFSAACHLKLAIVPYGHDLLKVSLNSLRKESQQEKMAGAKLMTSLMASDDVLIDSISGGLLEARSILLQISTSDPSLQLRQVCQKLLVCLTSQ